MPQLFVNGNFVGDCEAVLLLHEHNALLPLLTDGITAQSLLTDNAAGQTAALLDNSAAAQSHGRTPAQSELGTHHLPSEAAVERQERGPRL